MSRALELRCGCGARQTFRAPLEGSHDGAARRIMAAIDNAGWQDEGGGGRGWMRGTCPACVEADAYRCHPTPEGDI